MNDAATQALTVPGQFQACHTDRGRKEGVYPSTLLLGVYRRHDRSPCLLYLRCWPDGRVEFKESDGSALAARMLVRSSFAAR